MGSVCGKTGNKSKKKKSPSNKNNDNNKFKKNTNQNNDNNKFKKNTSPSNQNNDNNNLNQIVTSSAQNNDNKNLNQIVTSSAQNNDIIIQNQNLELSNDIAILKDFEIPILSDQEYKEIEKKIEEETGFKTYYPLDIKLNKIKHKINGTYFQYNKGCILYTLINGGWIDENLIPDSMKYYKDHNHKEDKFDNTNLLRRSMSILDLSQLWMNIGGNCPYLEINLQQIKNKIYLVLKEYFNNPNDGLMKKIASMTWQNKDYFELIGKINVKYTPLREKLKTNPCIKNGIEQNIIKNEDIIKFGRHFIIFEKIIEEGERKIYSFQDSLSYFFKSNPTPNHNNCECDKKKGFVFTQEDTGLININDSDEMDIGILEVVN